MSFLTVYTCELSKISQLGAVRALHGRALQSKAAPLSGQGVGVRVVELNGWAGWREQDLGHGFVVWVAPWASCSNLARATGPGRTGSSVAVLGVVRMIACNTLQR